MRKRAVSGSKQDEPDSQDTSERLLDTLEALMIERRTTSVSIGDITKRCGVNAALVSYHFNGKSGMLMALLNRALKAAMKQIAFLTVAEMKVEEKLRIHISGIVNSYFQYPYVNRLMHQMIAEDPETFGPLIAREFSTPVAELHAGILKQGVAEGRFVEVDPVLFYFHLVGACDHLFYGRYQMKYVFGIEQVSEDLKRSYIDYIYNILVRGMMRGDDAAAAPDGNAIDGRGSARFPSVVLPADPPSES